MDALLFHPKIVHLPIALAILLPLVSGGLLVSWLVNALPQRTLWVAVVLQALLVGSSFLAVETGEEEEERVEEVVSHDALHHHEEAAEVFAWTTLLPLPFLLFAAVTRREQWGRAAAGVGVVSTLVVTGLGIRTGQAGGELVYVHNAGAAYSSGNAASGDTPSGHGHEDDAH